MADLSDDIKDIKHSVAYNFLSDMERDGKLDPSKAADLKEKFRRLHEIVVQSFENEKTLLNKARELRQDLTRQQHKLETVSQQQGETSLSLERLTKTLEDTQNDLDEAEKRVQQAQGEVNIIEQDVNEAKTYLSQREEEQEAKLKPELERFQALIDSLNEETQDIRDRISKEEAVGAELQESVVNLTNDTENLEKEVQNQTKAYNNTRNEPTRFSKNANVLEGAIKTKQIDLDRCNEDIAATNKEIENSNAKKDQVAQEKMDLQREYEEIDHDISTIKKETDEIEREAKNIDDVKTKVGLDVVELGVNYKTLSEALKRVSDKNKDLTTQLIKLKKSFKKDDHQYKQISNQFKEIEDGLREARERRAILEQDHGKQREIIDKLDEEHEIMKHTTQQKKDDEGEKVAELHEINKEIEDCEKKAQHKRGKEAQLVKEMERLSMAREYMARKASQNLAQARETAEELKIKELFLIDLRKKKQETELKLKSNIAMYDAVKNARNRYVKLIQNSQQELAETKERIKILQNEVEILRNESAEKERKLKDERINVQRSLTNGKRIKDEINKLEAEVKEKESLATQQVNEMNKLTEIIRSLEKEMESLKTKYETVCEDRNYTGIQLIDRNDELCILYEKLNIQDNVQKTGETEIKAKEDEIRMLKLELQEVQRKIQVVRKRIPDVPILASQLLTLNNQLESEKKRERELANELEDPSNPNRFRELKGEDPEDKNLEAKIQTIEERLNNKKEQLLEKELVLEEITNLADKLRAQALTGRQSTLDLAEKVNEFQARIKQLTRKMMATVSELSMYQATSLKLQAEKERLEELYDTAKNRVSDNLPPLPECEEEWIKMERNRIMNEQERKARLLRDEEERAMVGAVTKSTAEPRLGYYVPPDDEIGLPKPYGKHPPFVPSQLGSNMRHYRKPVSKPIEI